MTTRPVLEHQLEALGAIKAAWRDANRATVVMACATGKTLVGQLAAEEADAETTVVFVPSLALMRQVIDDWRGDSSWGEWDFACACSDATVVDGDEDEQAVELAAQADMVDDGFLVTTAPGELADFLRSPRRGPRVVFSTYQSAPTVGAATKEADVGFDFGVFDEAHRTAGREGGRFSWALNEANIRIGKRLFMTATPRHYDHKNISKSTRKDESSFSMEHEDEALPAFSMENEAIYGKTVVRLDFREAIDRKLICDYRIVVTAVTSDDISADALRDKGGDVLVRDTAMAVALRKAIDATGARHVFTFHNRVKDAARFVGANGPLAREMPDLTRLHVSGAMRAKERGRKMSAYVGAGQAVMSSARCLCEGVNTPATDMTAFLSPRRSRIDIAQAVGRSLRLDGEKNFAYVMVPIFIDRRHGETMDEAVQRSDMSDVWDILDAMREQDPKLRAALLGGRAVARRLGSTNAHLSPKDEDASKNFNEMVDFVDFGALRQAVSVEILYSTRVSWDDRLEALSSYRERFGHCDVPWEWTEDPELARWVSAQRTARKAGKLTPERIERLDALDFGWVSGRRHNAVKPVAALQAVPQFEGWWADSGMPVRTIMESLQAYGWGKVLWVCRKAEGDMLSAVGFDACQPVDVPRRGDLAGYDAIVCLEQLPATLPRLGTALMEQGCQRMIAVGAPPTNEIAAAFGLVPKNEMPPPVDVVPAALQPVQADPQQPAKTLAIKPQQQATPPVGAARQLAGAPTKPPPKIAPTAHTKWDRNWKPQAPLPIHSQRLTDRVRLFTWRVGEVANTLVAHPDSAPNNTTVLKNASALIVHASFFAKAAGCPAIPLDAVHDLVSAAPECRPALVDSALMQLIKAASTAKACLPPALSNNNKPDVSEPEGAPPAPSPSP